MGLHTATFRGKPVMIRLTDGEWIVGRFLDRTGRGDVVVATADRERRIPRRNIRSFCPLKGPAYGPRPKGGAR